MMINDDDNNGVGGENLDKDLVFSEKYCPNFLRNLEDYPKVID